MNEIQQMKNLFESLGRIEEGTDSITPQNAPHQLGGLEMDVNDYDIDIPGEYRIEYSGSQPIRTANGQVNVTDLTISRYDGGMPRIVVRFQPAVPVMDDPAFAAGISKMMNMRVSVEDDMGDGEVEMS